MLTKIEKSAMFKEYNALRGQVEPGRRNRALGLAQSQNERPYETTSATCTCPDFAYRGKVCKHIAALRLVEAARRAARDADQAADEAEVKQALQRKRQAERAAILAETNELLFG